jgi:hypothetical protein
MQMQWYCRDLMPIGPTLEPQKSGLEASQKSKGTHRLN